VITLIHGLSNMTLEDAEHSVSETLDKRLETQENPLARMNFNIRQSQTCILTRQIAFQREVYDRMVKGGVL